MARLSHGNYSRIMFHHIHLLEQRIWNIGKRIQKECDWIDHFPLTGSTFGVSDLCGHTSKPYSQKNSNLGKILLGLPLVFQFLFRICANTRRFFLLLFGHDNPHRRWGWVSFSPTVPCSEGRRGRSTPCQMSWGCYEHLWSDELAPHNRCSVVAVSSSQRSFRWVENDNPSWSRTSWSEFLFCRFVALI